MAKILRMPRSTRKTAEEKAVAPQAPVLPSDEEGRSASSVMIDKWVGLADVALGTQPERKKA